MFHPFPGDRANAIERAQTYINSDPLFLDTETTGLSGMDEICEIAIVDVKGEVLINTLVKPTKRIDHNTSQIHGITDEMVKDMPTFGDLLPRLEQVLRGREVLIYNLEFDAGKLLRSAHANGYSDPGWWHAFPANPEEPAENVRLYKTNWHCAMELYAAFYGDWNDYHGNYRWQRLSNAALQCGIELPLGIHRAHADAELTRQVMLHVAEQQVERPASAPEEQNNGGG